QVLQIECEVEDRAVAGCVSSIGRTGGKPAEHACSHDAQSRDSSALQEASAVGLVLCAAVDQILHLSLTEHVSPPLDLSPRAQDGQPSGPYVETRARASRCSTIFLGVTCGSTTIAVRKWYEARQTGGVVVSASLIVLVAWPTRWVLVRPPQRRDQRAT